MVSILLFMCILHTITSFGIAPITPSASRATGLSFHPVGTRTTATHYYFANPGNDDNVEQEIKPISPAKGDGEGNNNERPVTLLERARIISYRLAIGASALVICIQAVDDIGFLEGTGANIDRLVQQSTNALPFLTGGALCLSTVPRNKVVEIGTISLGLATVGSGLASAVVDIQQLADISWSLSILALLGVSVREIYYFGVAYKQECVISSLMLPLMLDHSNHIPFTIPLCALGLAVLAAGKLFEPCGEDLMPSNSEFLAK